jgi:hypothetical protein
VGAADFGRPQGAARRLACELGLAEQGQVILLLAGFGQGEPVITALPV